MGNVLLRTQFSSTKNWFKRQFSIIFDNILGVWHNVESILPFWKQNETAKLCHLYTCVQDVIHVLSWDLNNFWNCSVMYFLFNILQCIFIYLAWITYLTKESIFLCCYCSSWFCSYTYNVMYRLLWSFICKHAKFYTFLQMKKTTWWRTHLE